MGFLNILKNGLHDAENIVNPMTYVHAGGALIHHPIGTLEGMGHGLAGQFEHPIRFAENHPLDALLSILPAGRLAALGNEARIASLGSRVGSGLERLGEVRPAMSVFDRTARNYLDSGPRNNGDLQFLQQQGKLPMMQDFARAPKSAKEQLVQQMMQQYQSARQP